MFEPLKFYCILGLLSLGIVSLVKVDIIQCGEIKRNQLIDVLINSEPEFYENVCGHMI